jgi:hypothetical protein
VVPASGNRASLFSITARSSSIAIYTWTPIKGFGQGRSWYDGYVSVVFAPVGDSVASCSVTENPRNYSCRGAHGVNKGLQACGRASL